MPEVLHYSEEEADEFMTNVLLADGPPNKRKIRRSRVTNKWFAHALYEMKIGEMIEVTWDTFEENGMVVREYFSKKHKNSRGESLSLGFNIAPMVVQWCRTHPLIKGRRYSVQYNPGNVSFLFTRRK